MADEANASPLHAVLRTVVERDPHERAFHRVVADVFRSLVPLCEEHPEYAESGVFERLVEPERQLLFRVPWVDDDGTVHVQRGYRVGWNGALGPYKGGLRFHPKVDLAGIKALAFEQTIKNALTGLPIGGAKGGADFDPKGKSDTEVMRFCQGFMTALHHAIGEHVDVPAGDMGVGERELGYLFGQFKRLTGRHEAGALTGKGVGWGGSAGRKQATGYGVVYFLEHALAARDEGVEGRRVVVSGSGNVSIYAMEKLTELGATVVACSDSSGTVVDEDGIDVELVKTIKERRRERLAVYVEERGEAEYREGGVVWDVPCELALPCATQDELEGPHARTLVEQGCVAVAEGANVPCTAEAVEVFRDAGVLFCPGKAANAGGVSVSVFEMQQNARLQSWSLDRVDGRLREVMHDVFLRCHETAEAYGAPGDYVVGANVAGVRRVAEAMLALGVT